MAVPLVEGPLSAPSTRACTYRPCTLASSTLAVHVYLDAMVCGIAQLHGVVGKHFDVGRKGELGVGEGSSLVECCAWLNPGRLS